MADKKVTTTTTTTDIAASDESVVSLIADLKDAALNVEQDATAPQDVDAVDAKRDNDDSNDNDDDDDKKPDDDSTPTIATTVDATATATSDESPPTVADSGEPTATTTTTTTPPPPTSTETPADVEQPAQPQQGSSDPTKTAEIINTTSSSSADTKPETKVPAAATSRKPVSPFAKFQQLDRQSSTNSSPSSPGTPPTPKTPGGSTPTAAAGAPLFRFTDPVLQARASTIKDILLQWCQSKTAEYENVQVTNFSTAWSDGLAFCALIHHFYPDAFDYAQLTAKQRRHNFTLAFRVADEKAGIAPLLDVEDMVVMRKPDWKCVFTYVQSIHRRFRNVE